MSTPACSQMQGRECSPHPNPRFSGKCVRCSQRLYVQPVYNRQPPVEDAYVQEIATGLGLDATALNAFANARAHDGPVLLDRSLRHEFLEEVADGRNYLVWRVLGELEGQEGTGDQILRYQRALGHVIAAWCELAA